MHPAPPSPHSPPTPQPRHVGEMTQAMRAVYAVHPTAPPARPMLPLSITATTKDAVDWPLTILVAMSFLLHFGIVGAMYSDWTDPVLDESFVVSGLVDMGRTLPTPDVEDPAPPAPATTTTAATPTNAPTTNAPPTPARGRSDARPARDPNAGLVEAAERMRLDLLATTAPGSALADALARSNVPPVTLADPGGTIAPSSDLTLHGASVIDPSARRSDLSTALGTTRKDGNDHVAVRDTPGPLYSVDARPLPGTTRVPSAERTVAALRPAFRRCYELGLQKDASMSGDVTIRARLRPTGEVDTATIAAQNGLSPEVASCIQRKVATAEFEKPEGGGATIDIPVKFVRQR